MHEIDSDEYDVFTAVCRQTDLFLFGNAGLTFCDETRGDPFAADTSHHGVTSDRLSGPAKWICRKHPEILEDFNAKNARRWKLEPKFTSPGGYEMISDRDFDPQRRPFILSRAGFNSDRTFALVYIEYIAACAYYLLFARNAESNEWIRKDYSMAWVV